MNIFLYNWLQIIVRTLYIFLNLVEINLSQKVQMLYFLNKADLGD